ncbi:hypothetical protein EU546_08290 [Candidatus Thorarchaeota archaeon]|nr:MAG: hypothetical protein EU546_08290 [Candidatus Thorarchaeota archaeon]
MELRTDSKSIALLAVFTAMVVAMEAVSIPFVTDIRVVGNFSIDWTGIVIMIVFLGLGFVFSLVAITVMWASIAYRSISSATFKGVAELLTVLGVLVAAQVMKGRDLSRAKELAVYLVFACLFRAVGMYFANIALPIFFFGLPVEAAIATSLLYLPWNVVQAIINIILGWVLYNAIPRELAIEAGFGEYHDIQKSQELADLDEDGPHID